MMNNAKALFRVVKQLNYVLSDSQKIGVLKVFASMLISSVLELLGVSVIYPVLQLIMDENVIRYKWYTRWIFDFFPSASYRHVLIAVCFFIIVVYLVKNAGALFCSYIQNRFATAFRRELSTTMLHSFMKRPYEFFVNTSSERIMECILGNTAGTYNVLLNLFQFVAEGLTMLFIVIYLVYTDWIMAMAAFLLAIGCFLLIILAFKKRLKQAGKDMLEYSVEQAQRCRQAIVGIKEITVMDRRDCFVKSYNESAGKVEKVTLLNGFLASCPDRILEGICIGGFVGIACIRVMLSTNAVQSFPALGVFAMGAFKILPSISKMSTRINGIVFDQMRLTICTENLMEARKLDQEERDRIIEDDSLIAAGKDIDFSEMIDIRGVCWRYRNSTINTLNDLNLVINKGEAVALIGASGAGKTTLADVILGLLVPQKGRVYMDGIDIATIPHTWAKMVGYVPQSIFLIDDTIRANVAFGLPDDDISDERVWKALKKAQLDDFVKTLPKGIDTVVGERGVKFSGGQRQRIVIARVLYDDPAILIFDEATSALDNETESAVMESIDALLGQKTIIIIAHRLTTIKNCDKVYEIKDGKAYECDKQKIVFDL